MIPTDMILSLHVLAVIFTLALKLNSQYNKPVIWRINRLDCFILSFVVLNAVLSVYDITAFVFCICLVFLSKLSASTENKWSILSVWLVGVGSFLLAIHVITGFYRPIILEEIISTNNNIFSLYLSTDKALAGLVLLAYLSNFNFKQKLKTIAVCVFSPLMIVGIAFILGIKLDIKYGNYLLWFIPINLFVTSLSEEVFFRELIQKGLGKLFPKNALGSVLTVFIVSYIFAVAHGVILPSSPEGALIFLAGVLYASVYQLTKSVFLCVITHFSMNMLHILLLEYPLTIT